ncbi:MAG TPA: BatA and WFA domain-containing protein [Humisphaera sp.]|jgi:hypothetical protein|nr:BatA and WFA domain-containing protein [Humisphaera sp.]
MTLLHPWALFAGLAVALPLLIHWLTRPRPVGVPLSTIRFVREAVRQRRARYRLRDYLILLLRAIAVLALVAAFCRPLLGPRPLVKEESAADTNRVVLVDQSLGMAATSRGVSSFDRARAAAAKYLTFAESARADLILAAAKPHAASERLTGNFAALRDELAAARPLPQRLDVMAAINQAAELLAASPPDRQRELVIISNFQRSNWAAADFSPLPKDTKIQIESVAPIDAPPNVAILKVTSQGRAEVGREARLEIDVANYSSGPREIKIDVNVGRAATSLTGTCAPGATTTLVATMTPAETGWQAGEARLVGVDDALEADNVRSFVLEVRPRPTYALITREPAAPQPTSSHFLQLALAPYRSLRADEAAGEHERVARIQPADLDRDALGGADLIVVDHPGKISQQAAGLMVSLARRGRPILYVAAEPVDATNLRLLSQAAGADLKMPVEFLPPPPAAWRRDLFLTEYRRNESPFAAFGESLPAALGPLRFGGGLSSRAVQQGLADDVLASYSDRSACLVVSSIGAGTLAVLNADLNQSNLAGSPVFVPLVAELVDRLMGRRGGEASPSGEPLAAYLPSEAGAADGLAITGPNAPGRSNGQIMDDANFVVWRWDAAGPPGVYAIKRDARTVFALATAAPAQASNLATIDLTLFKGRLAGGRTVAVQAESEQTERRNDAWAWILVACAGCLLVELLVLGTLRT